MHRTSPGVKVTSVVHHERIVSRIPVLFVAASFLAAFLLFLLQPMIGKMILPRFGGVPAVWNTCQLFFQFALLVGYGYAHLSVVRLGIRRQLGVHLVLLFLPLISLPIALPAELNWTGAGSPIPPLLALLTLSVGLPFLVVSTTAPLLQRWYAESGQVSANDPYFLYAASNLGSMVALIGYPLVVEPTFTLAQQGWLWAIGFAILAMLITGCGLVVRFAQPSLRDVSPKAAPIPTQPIAWSTRLHWVALAFVPSSLLLGVTTHITTDIAPIPILWVVPLALYLLSFVLVFLKLPPWVAPVSAWVFVGSLLLMLGVDSGRWPNLGLNLLCFFTAAMVLHGELARRRPPATQLTEFYLLMSLGGVLGGVANAILAPVLLNGFFEYQAAMVLACWLMPSPWPAKNRELSRLDFVLPMLLGLIAAVVFFRTGSSSYRILAMTACGFFARRPIRFGLGIAAVLISQGIYMVSLEERLYQSRNFFGVLTVTNRPDAKSGLNIHKLAHGTTEHGAQFLHDDRPTRRVPRGYYYPTGPIGQVFTANIRRGWNPPVAVIGLGTGSLASYAGDGQEFAFFEIDPDVVKVAQNRKLFTYLAECPGQIRLVLGDARMTIAREPAQHYGLIVVDAFSSDAIPIHLLTTEAMDIYLDKLTEDGVIAFHISNNYLDLSRVLDGLANVKGLTGLSKLDDALTKEDVQRWKRSSEWVVLARRLEPIRHLVAQGGWETLPNSPRSPVWTDDYSSVLSVLQFKK